MRVSAPLPGARRIILATPEKHLHELGLLAGAFLCASRGFEPVYLGAEVPLPDIELALKHTHAEVVVLSARDFSLKGTVPAGNGVFHMWASPAVHQLWVVNDVDNTTAICDDTNT